MIQLFFALSLISNGLAVAADPGFPSIAWKRGSLVASPAPDHAAQAPFIEILEAEECSAEPASKTSIKISGRCEFLKALYSYSFREPKSGREFRTRVGFTFSGQGAAHILMVSGPFVSERTN